MSRKVSTFFPNYQLRDRGRDFGRAFTFRDKEGNHFSTKVPLLGMTETQKVVLNWLCYQGTPPVISISHRKPTVPDRTPFCPDDLHCHYHPYAMAVATVQCLGETTPRIIKVYFCDIELHEGDRHNRDRGVYVTAVTAA